MDREPWLALLGLLGMLLMLAFGLVALSGSVWLMIWPVERRARATQGRFRFRLIDLGCLLVYWQSVLATFAAIARGVDEPAGNVRSFAVMFGVVFALVGALVWSVCVSVLSRAGIESSARRATFILISIPGAIASAVTFVLSAVGLVIGAITAIINGLPDSADPRAAISIWVAAILLVVSSLGIYLLRLVSLWIASDARAA